MRAGLQAELLGILRRLRKTVIFVTHDIDEAIRMGDLVAIMKDGRLVQYAAPEELLSRPPDAFVADFVGADRALKRLTLIDGGRGGDADTGQPRRARRFAGNLAARCPLAAAGQRRRRCRGRRCRRHAIGCHLAGDDPRACGGPKGRASTRNGRKATYSHDT